MPLSPPFPSLETARLRLREITYDDAEALFAIHGSPERIRWYGADPLPDLATAHKLINVFIEWRKAAIPAIRWAIEKKEEPGLIGTCGLFGWNQHWRSCVLGFEMTQTAEGVGLMSEAVRAAIQWGFANMHINRISAHVHPENNRSGKLLSKLGFINEGRLRQFGYWSGAYHDMFQYGLLKRDWNIY